MTRFESGDIVRVPFPHVQSNHRRYRPALVVTREPIGPDGLLIWAAMITNAERQRWLGDVVIDDHRSAGLPISSMVRTAKIATLESSSAERIGRLPRDALGSVMERVRAHLDQS